MPGPSVLTSGEISSNLGQVRKLPKLVETSGSGDPKKSKEKKLTVYETAVCTGR